MYTENSKELTNFSEKNKTKNIHGPLLLSVDKYTSQNIKIIFIG